MSGRERHHDCAEALGRASGTTAYLYVRQSTLRQVKDNTESAERQYALRQRAVQLGWHSEQIVVIDSDQGQSGASSTGREGFQRLVADVGLGKAGIVLGLEVSRLARNNADWHRLLEICALSRTLICDEDGLYDPADFNDRLLLGLKGTMSEAELHFIRARLQGGIISKARRGELPMPLPVGLVQDPAGKVVLDPDVGVQRALRHLFDTFARTGSARAVVQAFNRDGLLFPARVRFGERKGELVWSPLTHWRVLRTLHNPRYAGAFAYGQRRTRKTADGKTTTRSVPREQWTLIPDSHPGYITFEQYEHNLRTLAANATAHDTDRVGGPAREGTALLQGLAVCGRCGHRMTVRYHTRKGVQVPDYQCVRENIQVAREKCQVIQGAGVDSAISQLLLDTVTPLALEVALNVQAELEARADEADQLRQSHVERARQRTELARRRYLAVDPDNRLVADTLEADWNDALRALQAAQDEYVLAASSSIACNRTSLLASASGTPTRRAARATDRCSRSISATSRLVSSRTTRPAGLVAVGVAVAIRPSVRAWLGAGPPSRSARHAAPDESSATTSWLSETRCSAASVESLSCSSCGIRTITRPECAAFGSFVRIPVRVCGERDEQVELFAGQRHRPPVDARLAAAAVDPQRSDPDDPPVLLVARAASSARIRPRSSG